LIKSIIYKMNEINNREQVTMTNKELLKIKLVRFWAYISGWLIYVAKGFRGVGLYFDGM